MFAGAQTLLQCSEQGCDFPYKRRTKSRFAAQHRDCAPSNIIAFFAISLRILSFVFRVIELHLVPSAARPDSSLSKRVWRCRWATWFPQNRGPSICSPRGGSHIERVLRSAGHLPVSRHSGPKHSSAALPRCCGCFAFGRLEPGSTSPPSEVLGSQASGR